VDLVEKFSDGLARLGRDNEWKFIDKAGKKVLEPKLRKVRDFSEGLAAFGDY